MAKVVVSPSEVRKRGYKVLLYADNRDHMRAFSRIRRNKGLFPYFVGCWHTLRCDSGAEVLTGLGKKHCHIIFSFPNPRYWSGVLSDLQISEQFCRPIGFDRKGDTIEKGLVYLIHANAPDKEQYTIDDLFGSPSLISDVQAAVIRYQMRHVTLADSLAAVRRWVTSHYGQRITPVMFVDWIVKTPYVKSAQNPWIRQMIDDHNWIVSQQDHQQEFKDASRWCSILSEEGWEEIV